MPYFKSTLRHWTLVKLFPVVLLASALSGIPDGVMAKDPGGSFHEFSSTLGFGGWKGAGSTQAELEFSMGVLSLSNKKYRAYSVEISYQGGDNLEFFSVMPRLEFGLGNVKLGGRGSTGGSVSAKTTYFALMTGYGSGTYWDDVYVPEYYSDEEIEVGIKGIPLYASVGYRRFGGFQFWVEAIGGLILVTGDEPDWGDAEAPSTIPSFGIRVGTGYDSFNFMWMRTN